MTLNWKPSAYWLLGALASFLALFALAFVIPLWNNLFLIPEFTCLWFYMREKKRERDVL